MAIVKLGATIVGIRGSIGGITFSANKAGPHVKSLCFPPNPTTPKQVVQRGFMAQMGTVWRNLSAANQASWDAFAASPPETDTNSLGETYLLSGFQWLCRINLRRLRVGLAIVGTAPTNTPTTAPTTFTLTLYPANGDADRCVIGYTSGEFASDYLICDMASAPGQGSNVWSSRFTMTWEALGQYATYSEAGVNYYGNFGATQVGQRFFARMFRQSASGIRSTPLETSADVVSYP